MDEAMKNAKMAQTVVKAKQAVLNSSTEECFAVGFLSAFCGMVVWKAGFLALVYFVAWGLVCWQIIRSIVTLQNKFKKELV